MPKNNCNVLEASVEWCEGKTVLPVISLPMILLRVGFSCLEKLLGSLLA